MTPAGSERVIAASALGATAAIVHSLGLGLVDLGSNPVALFAAAAATYVAAALLVPPPIVGLGQQVAAAWEGLSPLGRLALGAVAGTGVAWTVWLLRYPAFGFDSLTYHIPEIVTWVQNGSPGSIDPIVPGWPFANYPLTNEVLLSWGTGLGRSFVWIAIWPSLTLALLAGSGWLGLRALRVPAVPAALAVASACAAPLLTSYEQNGANTDLPALAWLVAAGALCAAALRSERAALLAPALLAAALSTGTKTTTAPLAAIVLAVTTYRLRAHLRALARPLVLAACAAAVVGGTWYLRNLIQHGSPTWPFFPLPWGDPAPYTTGGAGTFFERLPETLHRLGDPGYVRDNFLGGLIVLAGALIAPIFARRRVVTTVAGVTVLSVLLWMNAPVTGSPEIKFSREEAAFLASPRYLLPGAAAATLAIALAARGSQRVARVCAAVLAAALCANVWQLFRLDFPDTPSARTPIAGAVIGAIVALAVRRRPRIRLPRPAWTAAAVLGLAAALAAAAPGMVKRHARIGFSDAALIHWFAGPAADGRPIQMAPFMIGVLADDDLSRRLEVVGRRESCRQLAARTRRGWVVVLKFSIDPLFGPSTTRACVKGWRPRFEDIYNWVYGPGSV
jgi:hypothetical protein